jgi:DNA/RNA-binding domain of Phe-tRNA-synthetase-like protein
MAKKKTTKKTVEAPAGVPQEWEVAPQPGVVDPELAEEFPGLSLLSTTVEAGAGRSPEALKERLRGLSDRVSGAQVIQLRQQPIPWAYRVFFRHIGLDPDETRTPIEQLALDRMQGGRFKSYDRISDAITIAIAEVGAAMLAFDADQVEGGLRLRLSGEDEMFVGRVSPLPPGTMLIADDQRPLAVLFRQIAEGTEPSKQTKRTTLVAIGVRGVPEVALEEALWVASSAMHA